ncbi:kinase [Vibrio ichthyoenteri ATCC 700023]|uniref:Kinase n=1 Tax=Vibrio ichthyoenteri ATCC 700023 TaxID=870968 RepID=F9RYU4_9VIBR|nr:AAA family ATPase [Vibrio ichthyoenteri]EGU46304.1 kinase [Vibrio ichthyoenteri ATCC 700023]
MTTPTLYIFSGLPGSGKSTLAQALAQQTGAVYLRIDTVEQALRDLCQFQVEGEGYRLSYRIASDNLKLGLDVIADSCNPIQLTRDEWQSVASQVGANYINIEIACSQREEHQRRVETRLSPIANLVLPTWQQVVERHYEPWSNTAESRKVIHIDTAGQSIEASSAALFQQLKLTQ